MSDTNASQTTEASRDYTKNKNLPFIAILCVLILAIIGLTTGIIITKINQNNISSDSPFEVATTTEISIQQEFQNAFGDSHNFDNGIEYLENTLDSGKTENGAELSKSDIFTVKLSLANLYIRTEQYNKSINILDTLKTSELTQDELNQLYSTCIYLYTTIGEQEKVNECLTAYQQMTGETL